MRIFNTKAVADGRPNIINSPEIILIIEDDQIISLLYANYSRVIQKKAPHIQIVTFPTVKEALEFYKNNLDHIKTVVVDDTLEDKKEAGPEIARAIITQKLDRIIFNNTHEKLQESYLRIKTKVNNESPLTNPERELIAEHVTIFANSGNTNRNHEIMNAGATHMGEGKSFMDKLMTMARELSEALPK